MISSPGCRATFFFDKRIREENWLLGSIQPNAQSTRTSVPRKAGYLGKICDAGGRHGQVSGPMPVCFLGPRRL